MRELHSLPITDDASVGAARRSIHAYATGVGFDEQARAEIDIIVQEIGTNAVRYASNLRDGDAMLHWTRRGSEAAESATATTTATPFHRTTPAPQIGCAPSQHCGIEIFYADKGPGIYDLDRATRDHVSSGGGLGGGFGAIRRLSDECHIYSVVCRTERLSFSGVRRSTHGTAILCRKWVGSKMKPTLATEETLDELRVGAWSRPRVGEIFNGDAYFVRHTDERTLLAVVDGLGHGSGALAAARVAVAALEDWLDAPLDELMFTAHDALRATRGAVMSVALIDRASEKLHFAGVGNIHTRIFNAPKPAHPLSINGTLGTRLAKVPVWVYDWTQGATLLMASDGLSATWDMSAYPGLLDQPPQLVAGVLMRDYGRDSDDATVIVAR